MLNPDHIMLTQARDVTPTFTWTQQPLVIPRGEPGEQGEHWPAAGLLPALVRVAWKTPVPPTQVQAMTDARAFHIRFACEMPNPGLLVPELAARTFMQSESVWVDLHPHNDPSIRYRFGGTFDGQLQATVHRQVTGETHHGAVTDTWSRRDDNTARWTLYHGVQPGGWWAEMAIPWLAIGLAERPPVIGLAVGRVYFPQARWPLTDTAAWPADPARPALAQLTPDAVPVAEVTLPQPRFGRCTGMLRLAQPAAKPLELRATVLSPDGRAAHVVTGSMLPGQQQCTFSYVIDRAQSSHVTVLEPPRLRVELFAQKGDELAYVLTLPVDRHLGVLVDEPWGKPSEFGTGDTPVSRATGREAWLDRIVRQLPRLRRATTCDGAPSDFCIVSEAGDLAVNLMADDAWQRLAEIVTSRFTSAEDRLVASMALIGQKSVTNFVLVSEFTTSQGKPAYHAMLHELLGPLSLLRLGGGTALARAAVLARLLQFVDDPATGQPFRTRVIALDASGGPRRMAGGLSGYFGPASRSPFAQVPGPVGAVCVDYAGSQTLLDPTALGLFCTSESRLATVEQIVADAGLRRDGAGRLADVYARIDVDELRREPVNVLLSSGVMPELAADEDGVERPLPAPHRHRPRQVDATGTVAVGLATLHNQPSYRQGDVRVERRDDGLHVTLRVRGVDPARFDPRDRAAECVHVAIDPEHGHARYLHACITFPGTCEAAWESAHPCQTLFKYLSTENVRVEGSIAEGAWRGAIMPADTGDGYEAAFVFPWQTLELDPQALPPTVGLNLWVQGRFPCYEQVFLSPPRFRLPLDPFSFADVSFSDEQDLTVAGIDLGRTCWGENEALVSVRNQGRDAATVTLRTTTRLGMMRRRHDRPAVVVTVPAGLEVQARVSYYADPGEKMTFNAGQVMTLDAIAAGKSFYRGNWTIRYSGPIAASERCGDEVGPPAANPDPALDDPQYLDRKLRYVQARVPRFERLTTRQGGQSDFVLRARDGSVMFDLMQAGVLAQIGQWIAGRFESDLDRILALYCFKMQPDVMGHRSSGKTLSGGIGPLSLLRANHAGGGGNCGPNSRAFTGLAQHLPLSGGLSDGQTIGVQGHVVAWIACDGCQLILDPDVGHVLFAEPGQLASIDDLCHDPTRLLTTASCSEMARYITAAHEVVRGRPPLAEDGLPGTFPSGAPQT